MATVNIKIAGKTYEGVEVLEVESADGDGVWLRFLPDTTAKTYDISYALSGCTVDDTERTISEGGSKTIRVTPEEGRALANDGDLAPVVSGATLVSYVADGDLDYILTISNPTANVAITLNAGYVFSVNVTDCTESPVGKRYFVSDSDKVTLSFMTGEGFAFDDSAVSATGMEFIMSVGMDHKTLAVTVSNPDTGSSERMLIVHASTQRTISYVTTGCTSDSSNPQYAPYYGTLDLWFTSSDGYYFPTAGTAVSGTSSWLAYTHDTQPDGTEVPVGKVLVRLNDLSQDTSDIVVTVTATVSPTTYSDCLTFTGESGDFTLKATNKEWDGTVYYSTDHSTWTVWDGSAVSSANGKLYLRGKGNTTFYTSHGGSMVLSEKAACSGNIQTLLDYENPPTEISADFCYALMFYDCTGLTQAPELPATTLASDCYYYMFYGCTGLTQAPELPATTLADACYYAMFSGCTGLTQAPELPATTLADSCYSAMFSGCTGIKLSTTQTGNYTQAYRIPTSGTGTTATNALSSMFLNTGGTFTGTPSINTTYYMDVPVEVQTLTVNGTAVEAVTVNDTTVDKILVSEV